MHVFASGRSRGCARLEQQQQKQQRPWLREPRRPAVAAAARRRRPQPTAASSSAPAAAPSPSPSAAAARSGGAPPAAAHAASPATPTTAFTATLLVQCPDQKGVIAALATLLAGYNCNVLASDQFTDADSYQQEGKDGGSAAATAAGGPNGNGSSGSRSDGGGGSSSAGAPRFFQRIHFDFTDLSVGIPNLDVLERAIGAVADRYAMDFSLSVNSGVARGTAGTAGAPSSASSAPVLLKKRCVVLVSKLDHCLYDLLIRAKNGELPMEVPVVASNHPDLEHVARMFGVDFEHVPIGVARADGGNAAGIVPSTAEGRASARKAHEARLSAIIGDAGADLVVLARYMQIMSPEFCGANWRRTVNIHHSFLPLSTLFCRRARRRSLPANPNKRAGRQTYARSLCHKTPPPPRPKTKTHATRTNPSIQSDQSIPHPTQRLRRR